MDTSKNKIRSLIIDDDPFIKTLLQDQLSQHVPSVEVTDTADSGEEGIQKIKDHHPELIFLDVDLSDMSGFEMMGNFKTPQFQTIFITSSNHYALKALRADALDYLIKPIDPIELKKAVEKFQQKVNTNNQAKVIRRSLNNLEELVLNILPKEIVEKINANKIEETTKRLEKVTVLFTDVKNFTQHSEIRKPEDLVKELHFYYSAFDRIMKKYGLEKIKTIGDAYMAAGGIPLPNDNHPIQIVQAALEIRDFCIDQYRKRVNQGYPPFQIRIGLHTGPVVAGIVGIQKFAYDIWGKTVNLANQMEKKGMVESVNISDSTFKLIQHSPLFVFQSRGKLKVKGTETINMYFVDWKKD